MALSSALADSPRTILQTLAEKVLEIVQADSAGLSLLTKDEKRFYWPAIAARGSHTSAAAPRAISARAAMCSTATFRCCSLTGSGVIHICAWPHRLPKRDCSSLFTSTAKRSARSGRSPTLITANSTPRTCGCLKAWVGSRRRRTKLWRQSTTSNSKSPRAQRRKQRCVNWPLVGSEDPAPGGGQYHRHRHLECRRSDY